MATTKVIKDLTEFNPGNPDYVLNATNAVTVINAGGNQYNFNGVYGKFGLRIGTTVLTGVPSGHPFAVLNNGLTGITYTGTVNEGTLAVGGFTYTFYSGDITITVTADFGVASYYCKIHGYMGGQDNLVSVYSEAGLRMPTGGAFSGTPAEGMMRNDTTQASQSSDSTMQHYNGTDWKNFVNLNNSTLTTLDYPVGKGCIALWGLQGNTNDASGNYNGTNNSVTFSTPGTTPPPTTQSGVFTSSNPSYIEIQNSGTAFNLQEFTWSGWYLTSSSGVFVEKYSNNHTGYIVSLTAAGKMEMYWQNGGANNPPTNYPSYQPTSQATLSTNTWYHIAITFSSTTGDAIMYINGDSATLGSSANYGAGYQLPYLSQNANIGYIANHATGGLNGQMAQLRYYNTALSASDVNLLYNES